MIPPGPWRRAAIAWATFVGALVIAGKVIPSYSVLAAPWVLTLPFSLALGVIVLLLHPWVGAVWAAGVPDAVGLVVEGLIIVTLYAGAAASQVFVAYHVVTELRETCRRRRSLRAPTQPA